MSSNTLAPGGPNRCDIICFSVHHLLPSLIFWNIWTVSWRNENVRKRKTNRMKKELYAFMHCSGNISSAYQNWLIALGTLFISVCIPSLKIYGNCSRKSSCHKFRLFSYKWVLEICVCLPWTSFLKANCERCQITLGLHNKKLWVVAKTNTGSDCSEWCNVARSGVNYQQLK